MIPIRDNQLNRHLPLVTWTLILLNIAIYLWDRQGQVFGPSLVFADLAMRPREVVEALPGTGDRFALVTMFTSMFLHANLVHLLGNMVFLLAFGNSVENTIGPFRYALYYIFWGLVAGSAHVFVDSSSIIPTVGASGAIGGVLGCYFLLFPGNKIEFIIPILPFWPFVVSAWIMLGMWFLWQIFVPQQGVANWAH
ncbi:MAG TPA: rhomboid family intramembrane serine protease, partial [Fimbriimonadaceae bacterium]|nr:rhomboid family intramembrane serine protease [Fimbriimonadaceae bacterium]